MLKFCENTRSWCAQLQSHPFQKNTNHEGWIFYGAGDGIRVGLQNLFNDTSTEAQILASQLELLKSHLGVNNLREAYVYQA